MTQVTVLDPSLKRAQSLAGTSSDKDRPDDDFYPTEDPEITRALLRVEPFVTPIWEPACGEGHMARVLAETGMPIYSSDLVDRGCGAVMDFLETKNLPTEAGAIVTNPPFDLFTEFFEHAIYTLQVPKLCLLGKLSALEGRRRSRSMEETGLTRVYVFRNRIRLTRNGKPYKNGGMIPFAWYVWEYGYEGPWWGKWIETVRA